MTPHSIVFKVNDRCNLEAFYVWQKKYGILRTKFVFLLCFVINAFAAVLTFFSMYLEESFSIIKAVLLILLETALFTFIIIRTLREKIVPEMAKNCDLRIKSCSDKTQVTLRENDFEIKTEYKKTNYFYDEIKYCFDKGTFALIVIDEYAYPIIIPLISVEKGSKDTFSSILREKLGGKYERGV